MSRPKNDRGRRGASGASSGSGEQRASSSRSGPNRPGRPGKAGSGAQGHRSGRKAAGTTGVDQSKGAGNREPGRSRGSQERGARGEGGALTGYWVPGERAVSELLGARPGAVKEVVFEEGRELPELEARALELGIRVRRRARDALEELVGSGLARGVVARAEPPPNRHLDELLSAAKPVGARRRILVALDQVVDPGNLGAILRSAEFFGAVGVLWAKDRSAPLSPLAVRASAGASERLPVCIVTNLSRALATAKAAGWWVVGTLPEGDESMTRLAENSPDDLVVVMGGEQKGMRRVTTEACDFKLRIDRVGELASLNVSAAAAVVLSVLGGFSESTESSDSD